MNILSIKNVCKQFNNNVVLQDVNAEINKGDMIALVGPPGAGKTTLLRCLNFLDPPTSGDVYFMGKKITNKGLDLTRRKIGMVFKESRLFSHLTIFENVALGPLQYFKISRQQVTENTMNLLRSVGLAEKANLYPHQLDEGQKLRTAIVRCLAMNPEIILFDDSANALEMTMLNGVTQVMKNASQAGKTFIIETSDLEFTTNMANRIFYMDSKCILEEGRPDQLYTNPKYRQTKDFLHKLISFSFEVNSKDFDFVELYGGMEKFCNKNYVDLKKAINLQLLIDEIITNIILPSYASCLLNISIIRATDTIILTVTYKDKEENILNKADNIISVKMIRKYATNIKHTFIEGINTLYVEV